jgi:hypothetical protein
MRSNDIYSDNAAPNDLFLWTCPALSKVTMTAIGSFLVVWWWLALVLHFDFMQADVLAYWRDSLRLADAIQP